jgi:hypothetical protein
VYVAAVTGQTTTSAPESVLLKDGDLKAILSESSCSCNATYSCTFEISELGLLN